MFTIRRSSPNALIAVASPLSSCRRQTNPGARSARELTGSSAATNSASWGDSSGACGSATLTWARWKPSMRVRLYARVTVPDPLGRHSGGQVPDHVGLPDPLGAGQLGHAVPGQGRLWQVVPACQTESFEDGRDRGAGLALGLDQRDQGVTLGV